MKQALITAVLLGFILNPQIVHAGPIEGDISAASLVAAISLSVAVFFGAIAAGRGKLAEIKPPNARVWEGIALAGALFGCFCGAISTIMTGTRAY